MAQPGTAPRIERRLATIMAMNVAGYNRLMGIDEVGTLNALKDHRRERIDPTIARHNGRVFKTTGNGLLVVGQRMLFPRQLRRRGWRSRNGRTISVEIRKDLGWR